MSKVGEGGGLNFGKCQKFISLKKMSPLKAAKNTDSDQILTHNTYEPVQVITLIWWPQYCKKSSLMIWIWWYPKPRFKRFFLVPAIWWCKLLVMVVCYFHGKKLFCCKKRWKKAFFDSSETALSNFRKQILP